jgi:hypothetical protein
MSDCDPWNYRYALEGMKMASFFERLELSHTLTLPSLEMNIIYSLMSKYPTFSYKTLKPDKVALVR